VIQQLLAEAGKTVVSTELVAVNASGAELAADIAQSYQPSDGTLKSPDGLRAGPGCLNRISASISGASAGGSDLLPIVRSDMSASARSN
jgi:hypothetical protein